MAEPSPLISKPRAKVGFLVDFGGEAANYAGLSNTQHGSEPMFGKEKNVEKEVREIEKTMDFSKTRYGLTLETSMGNINLEFFPEVAPGHVKNMVALAKIGFYDGIVFHRVISGFVIQGGCPNGNGMGGPGYKVKAEFNTKLHEAGVLSMARAQDPNSGGSQFFLCLDKVPYLDRQYTVFGKTADEASLNVVKSIGQVDTDGNDRPLKDVVIQKATVTEKPL